jgi:hypothetical protein
MMKNEKNWKTVPPQPRLLLPPLIIIHFVKTDQQARNSVGFLADNHSNGLDGRGWGFAGSPRLPDFLGRAYQNGKQ